MIEIKTYNGQEATFYIQAKGLHSGRPLKNPIPNSFAVTTDIKNAYEIVYSLWKAKSFYYFIGGSVVPFIRITDVKKIVFAAINKADNYNKKQLEQLNKIDLHIDNLNKQIELLKQMQIGLAIKINKDGKS
jgi:hypothetical protein